MSHIDSTYYIWIPERNGSVKAQSASHSVTSIPSVGDICVPVLSATITQSDFVRHSTFVRGKISIIDYYYQFLEKEDCVTYNQVNVSLRNATGNEPTYFENHVVDHDDTAATQRTIYFHRSLSTPDMAIPITKSPTNQLSSVVSGAIQKLETASLGNLQNLDDIAVEHLCNDV